MIADVKVDGHLENMEFLMDRTKRTLEVGSGTYLLNGDNAISLNSLAVNLQSKSIQQSVILEKLGIKSNPVRYEFCFKQTSYFEGTDSKKVDAPGHTMRLIFNNGEAKSLGHDEFCVPYGSGTTLETAGEEVLFENINSAINKVGKIYLAEGVYLDNAAPMKTKVITSFSGTTLLLNGKPFQNRFEAYADYYQELQITIKPLYRDFFYLIILLFFGWLGILVNLKKFVIEVSRDLKKLIDVKRYSAIGIAWLKIRLTQRKFSSRINRFFKSS